MRSHIVSRLRIAAGMDSSVFLYRGFAWPALPLDNPYARLTLFRSFYDLPQSDLIIGNPKEFQEAVDPEIYAKAKDFMEIPFLDRLKIASGILRIEAIPGVSIQRIQEDVLYVCILSYQIIRMAEIYISGENFLAGDKKRLIELITGTGAQRKKYSAKKLLEEEFEAVRWYLSNGFAKIVIPKYIEYARVTKPKFRAYLTGIANEYLEDIESKKRFIAKFERLCSAIYDILRQRKLTLDWRLLQTILSSESTYGQLCSEHAEVRCLTVDWVTQQFRNLLILVGHLMADRGFKYRDISTGTC